MSADPVVSESSAYPVVPTSSGALNSIPSVLKIPCAVVDEFLVVSHSLAVPSVAKVHDELKDSLRASEFSAVPENAQTPLISADFSRGEKPGVRRTFAQKFLFSRQLELGRL